MSLPNIPREIAVRRLYVVIVEDPHVQYADLADFEAEIMEMWNAQHPRGQIAAVRLGGLIALKVLEQLPPLRRGGRDKPAIQLELP